MSLFTLLPLQRILEEGQSHAYPAPAPRHRLRYTVPSFRFRLFLAIRNNSLDLVFAAFPTGPRWTRPKTASQPRLEVVAAF